MNERFQLMLDWLQHLEILNNKNITEPVPASSDASFRRYFRIQASDAESSCSYIIMDAPVEHEDCRPFIKVSAEMLAMGLNVPEVLAQDLTKGFLLLTDLGSTTYLSVLEKSDESTADQLYADALKSLAKLQSSAKQQATRLPQYDSVLLQTEMSLFSDWLLNTHLDIQLSTAEKTDWNQLQDVLIKSALQQPQVYVHRDYHSRNLMVVENGQQANPGILDFQDAVYGPLSYDAISLLRDCYIAWPDEQVEEWQRNYFLQLCQAGILSKDEWAGFLKAMDLMGIQRHLKASGIFARLLHRDGKDGYIADIPQTLRYIHSVAAKYPETGFMVRFLDSKVLPRVF